MLKETMLSSAVQDHHEFIVCFLQVYKNAIPCHSVYAPAIERIIHKLWHPGHEELDTESQETVQIRKTHSSSYQTPVR